MVVAETPGGHRSSGGRAAMWRLTKRETPPERGLIEALQDRLHGLEILERELAEEFLQQVLSAHAWTDYEAAFPKPRSASHVPASIRSGADSSFITSSMNSALACPSSPTSSRTRGSALWADRQDSR
jgi:hypothetical protein